MFLLPLKLKMAFGSLSNHVKFMQLKWCCHEKGRNEIIWNSIMENISIFPRGLTGAPVYILLNSLHYIFKRATVFRYVAWLLITLIDTFPSCFSISPSKAESREDFPDPTCPTTATSAPSGIRTLILREWERDTLTQEQIQWTTNSSNIMWTQAALCQNGIKEFHAFIWIS